jgi:uncharacterized protein YecE (DUF72 family)
VEIDYSWYVMPKAGTLRNMAEQSMSGFLFSIKAHRSLTHEVSEDWRGRASEFAKAVEALAETGKLAAILIQLPYRFSYTSENRLYLAELCASLGSFPIVVEFRNSDWYRQNVYDGLAQRNIGLAVLDRPELPGLPPETIIVTSPLVYYRLHGRNADLWWSGDATSRYEYDYSDAELKERARSLKGIPGSVSKVLVAFNNHSKGYAPKNAKKMADIVKQLGQFQ